jgi:hypothetical protein
MILFFLFDRCGFSIYRQALQRADVIGFNDARLQDEPRRVAMSDPNITSNLKRSHSLVFEKRLSPLISVSQDATNPEQIMIIMSPSSVPIPMTLITVYSAPVTASSTVVANVTLTTATPVVPGHFTGVAIGGILVLIAIEFSSSDATRIMNTRKQALQEFLLPRKTSRSDR